MRHFERRAVAVALLGAGAYACGSFGAADEPPVGPTEDAAADGGPTTEAAPSDDPCAGFVPPVVSYPDPTKVDCPGGTGLDVTRDRENCGVCGHVCETTCVSGACTGVQVASLPGLSASIVGIKGGYAYVIDASTRSMLYRAPLLQAGTDAGAELIGTTVADGGAAVRFEEGILGGDYAFLRGANRLLRIPLAGGEAVQLGPLTPNAYEREYIAASAQRIFVIEPTSIRSSKFDGDGVDMLPVSVAGGKEIVVTADEQELFWIAKGEGGGVFRRRLPNNYDQLVKNAAATTLRIDADFVYFVDSATSELKRVRRSAPAGTEPTTITTIEGYPRIAVDGTYVYFAATEPNDGDNARIARVHRCGGPSFNLTTAARDVDAQPVVDEKFIYYNSLGNLLRTPRSN